MEKTEKAGIRKRIAIPLAPSKNAPKGRLWVQLNSPGEPLSSPTCNWTLRVHSFYASLNIALAAKGED